VTPRAIDFARQEITFRCTSTGHTAGRTERLPPNQWRKYVKGSLGPRLSQELNGDTTRGDNALPENPCCSHRVAQHHTGRSHASCAGVDVGDGGVALCWAHILSFTIGTVSASLGLRLPHGPAAPRFRLVSGRVQSRSCCVPGGFLVRVLTPDGRSSGGIPGRDDGGLHGFAACPGSCAVYI